MDKIGPETRALVVDDFSSMRKVTRSFLSQLGVGIVNEAGDVAVAIEKIKKHKFDFIILDWNMPHTGGLELYKAIRAEPNGEKTPVIMVTADGLKDAIPEAVEAGVAGYLVKPYTVELLAEKLGKALSI